MKNLLGAKNVTYAFHTAGFSPDTESTSIEHEPHSNTDCHPERSRGTRSCSWSIKSINQEGSTPNPLWNEEYVKNT